MKRRELRFIVIAVVLLAIAGGLWWGLGPPSAQSAADILTSGFIEATEVNIAVELGGRITEITVAEGDTVNAGMNLVRLDDSFLKAQERQAQANVRLAEANQQLANVARDGTKTAWEDALDVQSNPLELEGRIIAAQGGLALAELSLARVREIETDYRLKAAEARRNTARKVLDNLENFEGLGLVGSYQLNKEIYPAEGELQMAELNLTYQQELAKSWSIPAAELQRDNASKAVQNLLAIRENPQEINAAVDRAHAEFQRAEAAVVVATQQLAQAQTALEVVQVQLGKLAVAAPISGEVAGRYAEPGEIASPGAPVLTITDLSEVTLTAYVPESKIGLVKLGEEAAISVDSYPGESFPGSVVFISPRAVFTPKNVQLQEEREKTVFAVKIRLANPERKLKPGMPADARIMISSGR